MKELKNMKGITLVSLVITIIVLIILAAVSINLTIGTDGIITRAKQAAENMEIAAVEEQVRLNELYQQLDGSVESGGVSYDKIAQLREQYDNLNTEYTNFKTQIAQAITNAGIETQNTDTVETMVNNITSVAGSNISDVYTYYSQKSTTTGPATHTSDTVTSPVDGVLYPIMCVNGIKRGQDGGTYKLYKNNEVILNVTASAETVNYAFTRDVKVNVNKGDQIYATYYHPSGRTDYFAFEFVGNE